MIHDWGLIEYSSAMQKMQDIHKLASSDGANHLIFCEHYDIFTVGYDDKQIWQVPTVRSDRGGSITCHSPGQIICYFCFQALQPAIFYRKVIRAYSNLFKRLEIEAIYDIENPGFYISNRKILSLGFRYRGGISMHGVSLNVDVDLELHSQINPCGLEGIIPTSCKAEGCSIDIEDIKELIIYELRREFDEI